MPTFSCEILFARFRSQTATEERGAFSNPAFQSRFSTVRNRNPFQSRKNQPRECTYCAWQLACGRSLSSVEVLQLPKSGFSIADLLYSEFNYIASDVLGLDTGLIIDYVSLIYWPLVICFILPAFILRKYFLKTRLDGTAV